MVDLSAQGLRNQRVVRKKSGFLIENLGWTSVGVLFVTMAITYSWTQHEITRLGYAIETLHEERVTLLGSAREVRAEYMSLTSSERLDEVAAELGLISTNRPEITIIEAGPSVSTAGGNLLASARPSPASRTQ
jgi:hypothetical protein